ncbi:hypothetical protein GCM10011379_43750 [Filimonas zeae]|uniref:Secretion system C-terminal sorting domain-containing protein n=2 Tax=Filimonas zeae TaxID=1737353 RepID=A0A917J1W4_9BACT|nr:hypothetical protein GCM10011379_43750 [Filimonas zeae]
MQPSDGWELIHKDLGYLDDNITPTSEKKEHSWLVLYNKYTGILRLLFKTCRQQDYDAMKIVIQFQNLPGRIQTNLFDLSNSQLNATNAERNNGTQKFESVVKYINDQSQWFYTDFPMQFDPCTCMYQSNINVLTHLVRTADIKLKGTASGTLKTIADINGGKGSVNDDSKLGFKDIYTDVKKTITNSLPGMNAFYSLASSIANTIPTDSIKKEDIKSAIQTLANNSQVKDFLKNVLLKDIPYVGTAMSVVDYFVLGGKKAGPAKVELMPMTINMDINLSGTVTTESNYHNFHFDNPGSKNAGVSITKDYPIYNEAMGVFTLLSTPEMIYRQYRGSSPHGEYKDFTFLSTPRSYYAINPASGLKVHDIQAQIIAEYIHVSDVGSFSQFNNFPIKLPKNSITGLERRGSYIVDFKCIGSNNMKFTEKALPLSEQIMYASGGDFAQNFYLKLIINLERIDGQGQNVLLVQTYPIKMNGVESVQNDPYFPPYDPFEFGYLLKPNITCSTSPVFYQATADDDGEFMYGFCANSFYKDRRPSFSSPARMSSNIADQEQPKAVTSDSTKASPQIEIYPNPASNWLTVTNMSDKEINTIRIISSNGVITKMLSTRQIMEKINVSRLPTGMYVVEVQNSSIKKSKKVIIQHN